MTLDLQAETRPAPAQQERGPAACALPGRRVILAGPLVAAATLLVALVAIDAAGVSLRDPAGVTLRRLVTTAVLVLVLVGRRRRGARRASLGRVVAVVARAAGRAAGALDAAPRASRWPARCSPST